MGLFKKRSSVPSASAAPDPAIEDFHRAMAAADQFPVAGGEAPATSAGIAATAEWMRLAYSDANYSPIFERRVEIGYDASAEGLSHDDWFAFNALGALAGLNIGMRDHPVVAMSAGYADSIGATSDEQREQLAEIKRRYFG